MKTLLHTAIGQSRFGAWMSAPGAVHGRRRTALHDQHASARSVARRKNDHDPASLRRACRLATAGTTTVAAGNHGQTRGRQPVASFAVAGPGSRARHASAISRARTGTAASAAWPEHSQGHSDRAVTVAGRTAVAAQPKGDQLRPGRHRIGSRPSSRTSSAQI